MNTFMEVVLVKEVIYPVVVVGISVLIYIFIHKMMKRMIRQSSKKKNAKKRQTILTLIRSILKYIILLIDILILLEFYGVDTKTILASLGVLGAVLGLAMQDLLKDLISGITILFEDQFRVGDTIQVGNFKGEVISVGLKTTMIRAYTGEVKIISNRTLTEVTNYNMKETLAIVDIAVAYESDLQKVERVLGALCIDQQEKIPSLKGQIELLGIQELANNGIVYRIIAPCKSMEHFGVERELRKAIKVAFDRNHITIPYPQVVLHDERI